MYLYASFPATSNAVDIFQSKVMALKWPLLALRLLKSCTAAIMPVLQIVTNAVVEKRNGGQRRTKVHFSGTVMQALELLQLAKRHILGLSEVE